jgi:hypothetical protein
MKPETSTPTPINPVREREAGLSRTPKFPPVIEAEKIMEEAIREACGCRNAISITQEAIASAEAQLAELNEAFPGLLARRALLQIKESEVVKARETMAAATRTIDEGAMALPVLEKWLSGDESGKAEKAERTIGLFERYHQSKQFLLAETYSGSAVFLSCWKRMQSLAAELGPEAVQDREAFVKGMKAIRPADFW